MTLSVLNIVAGAAALLAGRRLYWLFVSAVGFIVAADLASRLAGVDQARLVILIALAAGMAGAVLAVFLQRLAIGAAGFLAGGYVVMALLDLAGLDLLALSWVLALIGAIIGLMVILALFEWALIVLSSLAGAGIIVQTLELSGTAAAATFAVLVLVGVVSQGSGSAPATR